MDEVVFKSWEPGFRKASLTKMLQREAGLSLSEAKEKTDWLLEGKTVTVRFSSRHRAQEVSDAARQIGVIAEVRSSRPV
jgi:hypothetical protein